MDRCDKCPGINRVVPPDGPSQCALLFIGEAPGRDEDKQGVPFVGKTGMEVNQGYLPVAGLRRPNCRFTNAIHCLPPSQGGKLDPNSRKDQELLESCTQFHLFPEIEETRPKLIIPMGGFACRAIDDTIDLDLHHGIPRRTAFGMAFPMFHPALGMHEPKKMLAIRTDWYRLKKYLAGNLNVPVDQYPDVDYQEFTTVQQIRDYMDPTIPMAQDTESKRGSIPYCLSLSQYPGTGRMISEGRKDLTDEVQKFIDRWESIFIFHFLPADYDVMITLGLTYPFPKIRDTNAMAFHLGNIPQGLKALSFRELGMAMQDFEDVVTPHSVPKVMQYYHRMYMEEWPQPEEEMVRDEIGKWKLYRPQKLETKLKRFFTDYEKNPAKDIFKTWENWEVHHKVVQERMGPYPGKCISYVPYEDRLYYSCRDADATLRLAPVLEHMKRRVRKFPQEKWNDG